MVKLDLTRDFDVQLLHDMIDNPFCLYVHFAPPCGTSSRARLIQATAHDPEPCRDDTFPDGLPDLPDLLAQRVAAANRLYGVTAAALKRAVLAGKLVSCENPLNSFMWQTTAWRQGTSGLSLREAVFDHCCYGGNRPKHTLWVHNVPAFDQLNLTCPGESASHKHLPWGRVSKFRYATSEETAYPLGLCKAVAALLLEELCQRGFQLPARSLSDEVRQQHRAAQVSLGYQPRGKKVAPMVVVVVTSDHDFLPASAKLPVAVPVPPSASCDPPLPELPMGSRILRRVALGGGETPRSEPSSQPSSRNPGNPNCPVEQFASVCLQQKTILADDVIQLFQLLKSDRLARGAGLDDEFSWSTGAYAQGGVTGVRANLHGATRDILVAYTTNHTDRLTADQTAELQCAKHPRLMSSGVPPELQQTIDFLASEGMHAVGASRTEALRQWLGRAAELDEQERVYKETLPKHCAKTLGKKRLLLFGEMIEAAGHNDPSLVADMSKGFALGGPIPYCPEFRAKRTAATMAVDDLRGSAQRMRKGILNSTKSSGDDVVDAETYRVTLDEVERGWLDGPLKESDLGASSLLTRRFGVVQNNKTRPIDNYLESGLNATSSSYDTITVHTADCIASGLARRLRADAKCRLHQLLLKSWDLHKAYKNLPLSLEALEDSFLCVYDPKGKCPRIFRQKVLPFGSRHSVHAFCRVSLGIWKVLVVLFLCHINVYFDDFVGVELAPLARLFDIGVCLVFRLLGWDVAEDKESVFDSCAKVLGLKFDLSESRLGRITLCNTESRRDEIFEALSDILSSGYLPQKDGERIRGRLQFAENQIAGKIAGTAYKQLSRFVLRGGGHLDECTRVALLRLRDRVNFSPPRVICANILTTMHLYVDASCEGDNVGLGGVLVNEVGSKMGFFSERASEHVRRRMNPESGNPIFEYECLAILVGLRLWAPLIRSTNLVVFTDNEGALACMVAGISSNKYGEVIAQHVHVLCDELGLNIWFERVNTCSNVADAPSRGSKDPELGKEFTIDLDTLVDHAFESWGL
ncbi:ubiad1 [Symbiodinium natans]|uniref:Ubiad1 protein n=1 Tax=Symbiodinium natans TaxID=878477 RepID=A0A812J7B6_9DINO|nr:ubiad1 [Symbiodinium natans]